MREEDRINTLQIDKALADFRRWDRTPDMTLGQCFTAWEIHFEPTGLIEIVPRGIRPLYRHNPVQWYWSKFGSIECGLKVNAPRDYAPYPVLPCTSQLLVRTILMNRGSGADEKIEFVWTPVAMLERLEAIRTDEHAIAIFTEFAAAVAKYPDEAAERDAHRE